MKKTVLPVLMCVSMLCASGQDSSNVKKNNPSQSQGIGIGLKAGLNFANVTNASSINSKSETGFHAGVFFGGNFKQLMTFRFELLYSQQGYGYSTDTSAGTHRLDYITMVELFGINITHFVQVQLGFQTGYLINAQATGNSSNTGNATADQLLSLYNRFDYGVAGGLEVHPIMGLIAGARYCLSLNNLYKNAYSGNFSPPSVDFKNNIVQLYVGWRF